jgi:xanthine dehydrogenase accessory factor
MSCSLSELKIIIRGAGEMATGTACRLYCAGFKKILHSEIPSPLAVRRAVSFSEAVHEGIQSVEGITAVRISSVDDLDRVWSSSRIPVFVDPDKVAVTTVKPDVVIDAILAKRNTGTAIDDARLVIGLGPGFFAGQDVHYVIETNRGHNLGKVIQHGPPEPDTGMPGEIAGQSVRRVFRSPGDGVFISDRTIGEPVREGETVGEVAGLPVKATLDGVLRGLIRPGTQVFKNMKLGDVDPRGDRSHCFTISEKARAIGGGVLEAVLMEFNRPN